MPHARQRNTEKQLNKGRSPCAKTQKSNSVQLKVKPPYSALSYMRQKYIDISQPQDVLKHLDKRELLPQLHTPPYKTEDAAKRFECNMLHCNLAMKLQTHVEVCG